MAASRHNLGHCVAGVAASVPLGTDHKCVCACTVHMHVRLVKLYPLSVSQLCAFPVPLSSAGLFFFRSLSGCNMVFISGKAGCAS